MNVVGFDVGKDSVFGARLDGSLQVKQRFVLANTKAAIEPVLIQLQRSFKRLVIASEATAEYHRPLAELCLEHGIACRLLNPITTKQFVTATVRKKKTDITDAEAVARVAYYGGGSVVTHETFAPAKPMLRTATKLVQLGQMIDLMKQHIQTVLPDETALTGELAQCYERVAAAGSRFKTAAASRTPRELRTLLQSIPGVGPQTADILVAEIGDVNRFESSKKLIAYAGLDPRVRQSGKTLQRNTRLTKRGSPYLRRALYIAAAAAVRSAKDRELRAMYDRKRAEGRRHKEAVITVARKLTARVYAVWKRGAPYEIR